MKWMIYGAGFFGLYLCDLMCENGIVPAYILDRAPEKWNRRWNGVKIIAPDAVEERSSKVIIAHSSPAVIDEIAVQLQELGFSDTESLYDFAQRIENEYIFQQQRIIMRVDERDLAAHSGEVRAVADLFADEVSRETYRDIMGALAAKSFRGIGALPLQQQYMLPDVLPKEPREVFVDVGAGPAAEFWSAVAAEGRDFEAFYMFDPCGSIEKNPLPAAEERVVLVRQAVGDKAGQVTVRNYLDSNALICSGGEETAKCVRLDDVSFAAPPTFIKIDTEGYEREVLRGAAELIGRYRPVVACAVYHRLRDFWEIPLLMSRWPRYRLCLRSYMGVHETILYLIPWERWQ